MIKRYLLRVNTDKHPEVYKALEEHMQKDGAAVYLRQLIEKDIQERRIKAVQYSSSAIEVSAAVETWQPEIKTIEQQTPELKQIEQIDDVQPEGNTDDNENSEDFLGGLA